MRERLINNTRQPITLEDGTILAASGTDGSHRHVENLSERDRSRYVETGKVTIVEARRAASVDGAGDSLTPPIGGDVNGQQSENQLLSSTVKGRSK